jgi:hypothetical protein
VRAGYGAMLALPVVVLCFMIIDLVGKRIKFREYVNPTLYNKIHEEESCHFWATVHHPFYGHYFPLNFSLE